MNYESMSLTEVIDYINTELSKGRTMKDIEETDFNVSKGVITKRLNRKGYRKIDNKFIFDDLGLGIWVFKKNQDKFVLYM